MFIQLLICLFIQVLIIDTSHFHGGTITWRPLNNTLSGSTIDLQINQRWSWRRSFSSCWCDDSVIGARGLIGDNTIIICVSGNCSSWINSMTTRTFCTDFSANLDISSGENYIRGTFPVNIQFSIAFISSSWFASLATGSNSAWSVVNRINTIVRPDGYINSSPISVSLPIIYKQINLEHYHVVQMIDFDESDILKCRWSNSSMNSNSVDECGGICSGIPNGTLNQDNCTIVFTLTTVGQYAAVALQIEDYYNNTSTIPMSSIPLQFLFYGYNALSNCTIPPAIIGKRMNQDCISVSIGVNITEYVIVQVYCSGKNIIDFLSSSPIGMIKNGIENASPGIYQLILNWNPTVNQSGLHGLCVGAIDNTNIQSNQWCIIYLVGSQALNFIQSSASPVGIIFQNQTVFSIQSTKSVNRLLRNGSNIYFIDAINNSVVQIFDCGYAQEITYLNYTIIIHFSIAPWIAGHSYYVIFDSGVARGTEFCHSESPPITDPLYWTFNISNPVNSSMTTSINPSICNKIEMRSYWFIIIFVGIIIGWCCYRWMIILILILVLVLIFVIRCYLYWWLMVLILILILTNISIYMRVIILCFYRS